eukprot:6764092-Prymnesium_polylepis.2
MEGKQGRWKGCRGGVTIGCETTDGASARGRRPQGHPARHSPSLRGRRRSRAPPPHGAATHPASAWPARLRAHRRRAAALGPPARRLPPRHRAARAWPGGGGP